MRILTAVLVAMILALQPACSEEGGKQKTKTSTSAKRSSKPKAQPTPAKRSGFAPAWVGLKHRTADLEAAQDAGLKKARGVVVTDVTDESPADKTGIREDDVIVAYDGRSVKDSAGLIAMIQKTPAGKTVQVTLWRDGDKKVLPIITKPKP